MPNSAMLLGSPYGTSEQNRAVEAELKNEEEAALVCFKTLV